MPLDKTTRLGAAAVIAILVGAEPGCTRKAAVDHVEVHAPDGSIRRVRLADVPIAGAHEGRGYVSLADLGHGQRVRVKDVAGNSVEVASGKFGATYRLFVTRGNELQLVRYQGTKASPTPGAGQSETSRRRHRKNWETVLRNVVQLHFSDPPATESRPALE
ncbi:MAG: hypothetical protein V3T05_13105 [Myxococcota bacterium]